MISLAYTHELNPKVDFAIKVEWEGLHTDLDTFDSKRIKINIF